MSPGKWAAVAGLAVWIFVFLSLLIRETIRLRRFRQSLERRNAELAARVDPQPFPMTNGRDRRRRAADRGNGSV